MENNQQKIAKQILDNSTYGVYSKEIAEKITIEAIEIMKKSIEIRKNSNINIVLNNTDKI